MHIRYNNNLPKFDILPKHFKNKQMLKNEALYKVTFQHLINGQRLVSAFLGNTCKTMTNIHKVARRKHS